jgi:hypothetical protein
MIICLLLLFLKGEFNAFGMDINYDYKVLNLKSALARRADIIFSCNLNSLSKKVENYTLMVKPRTKGILIVITFQGKGIKIIQKLKRNQKISMSKLSQIDPLSGEVLNEIPVSFKKGYIELHDLKDGIYRISYFISDASFRKSIISPYIRIFSNYSSNSSIKKKIIFTVPIFFPPGSFKLDNKAKLTLKYLKNLKDVCSIKVIGYSDRTKITKSKVKSNEELSRLRALSVKNYLERK